MIPLACNLNAIPASERAAHEALIGQIFAAVLEKHELPEGYAFRLPAESDIIRQVAAFVANERLCCPFFRFEMVLEPDAEVFWLRLTGPQDGIKAFIEMEFEAAFS
jgi:hypothetical protein